MLVCIFIQLVGATLFGFIIAATRRIVKYIAPIQKATHANLQEIADYVADRRLGTRVANRLKRHFHNYYFHTTVFDERSILKDLPLQLQQKVWCLCASVQ
ncbi:unnamed protein product [Chrysoparadoxa australica]